MISMKKAVIVFSLLTELIMGACAGKDGADLGSAGNERGRIQNAQDIDEDYADDEDNETAGVYDMERIYNNDLFTKILQGEITPMTVLYGLGGEGGYVTAISQEQEIINGFIEAFRDVKICNTSHGSEGEVYVFDGGEDIVFGMEDGSQFNITMDGRRWIHVADVVFELDNTAKLSEMCVMMQEIAYMNQAGGKVPDDYIAVIRGGVGERTVETYVYELDEGYKYINVTSTTVSWGSPQWDHEVNKIGTVSTKEEVLEKAKEHGADNFFTLPGEFDAHPLSEFL